MAGNHAGKSVPRAGLRATVRFRWRSEQEPLIPREVFGRSVLLGALKLKVNDVYCLQTNSQERSFDVTLDTEEVCHRVLEESRRLAGVRPLLQFEVISLDKPNFRIITVHIYNPYIADQVVAGFMGRYAEVLGGPRRVNDCLGFWTGKRQYQVLLKPDPAGIDGWSHPPAFFSIGADRGYLFYSRQPAFCRRCRIHGHTEQTCGTIRCRFCQGVGHEAKDCLVPKTCHICSSPDHLARDCGRRERTYAAALVMGKEGGMPTTQRSGQPGKPVVEEPQPGPSGEGTLRPLGEVIGELLVGAGVDAGGGAGSALAIPSHQGPAVEERSLDAPPSGEDSHPMSDDQSEGGSLKQSSKKKKKRDLKEAKVMEGGEGQTGSGGVTSKRVKGEVMKGSCQGSDNGQGVQGEVEQGAQGGLQEGEKATTEAETVAAGQAEDGQSLLADSSMLERQEGYGAASRGVVLSPVGPDGYEGPLRPSPIPNETPFSWADLCNDSQMDMDTLYE